MELIDTPDKCEICPSILNQFFWFCKNCDKFICYKCLPAHVEHDIIALENVKQGQSKLLSITEFGGGPSSKNWVTFPKSEFLNRYKTCKHAIERLNETKVIFHCQKCDLIFCRDCLKKHKDHFPQHFVLLNDQTLRRVHYRFYDPVNIEVKTISDSELAKEGQNIIITVKIKNQCKRPIKDVIITILNISKDDNINCNKMSKAWFIECHHPNRTVIRSEIKIKLINPLEIRECRFNIRLPKKEEISLHIDDPFIIYTHIKYKNALNITESMYSDDLVLKISNS